MGGVTANYYLAMYFATTAERNRKNEGLNTMSTFLSRSFVVGKSLKTPIINTVNTTTPHVNPSVKHNLAKKFIFPSVFCSSF